ncbi:hypothetical protein LPJ63_004542 [Coemansia sp. RSA 2711]|nr:hypothetical protein LPJ63_004542 [Coemansia sp. RSA 2711]KAJ2313571.1 hypothetical protein IWW54_001443 [Coemansia sp. RSA 2705]KAJ2359961.1 hypothetical protein H4S01_005934 [Coemansia sp. RSA 2610]
MNLFCSTEPTQRTCGTTWQPVFPRPSRSALHSRTSSTSTIVDDIHMISPVAALPMPSPPPLGAAIDMAFKPALTAPCSPRAHLKPGSATPPYDRQPEPQSEPAAEPLAEPAAAEGDDCMFDMDAEAAPREQRPALDRAALSYAHTGKPQPWTVRRASLYDSLQAQIRAIDDDDNEFYPA